jgi:hypothetical protein
LTEKELAQLVGLVSKIKQPWPAKLYNTLAPLFTLTGVETVFVRQSDSVVEILLTQREGGDKFYADQWHSPGSMLRATDRKGVGANAFEDALQRVCLELKIERTEITRFEPVMSRTHGTPRGPELAMVFCCELNNDSTPHGTWFPVRKLPRNIVSHHLLFISSVVDIFTTT